MTPGSIGIGSGAVAVALAGRGIAMTQALATGLAIRARNARQHHLRLARTRVPDQPSARVARAATRVALVGASTISPPAPVGVVVFDLF